MCIFFFNEIFESDCLYRYKVAHRPYRKWPMAEEEVVDDRYLEQSCTSQMES